MSSSTLVPVNHCIARQYMLLFHQSTMRVILRSVSKSVTWYCCKIIVHCSTFLIHREQFTFQGHALRITIKLGFWGTLGRCMGCSREVCFFLYCVIKRILDRAPKRFLCTRPRLRVWLLKARKVISPWTVFSKLAVLRMKVPFNTSEVIA